MKAARTKSFTAPRLKRCSKPASGSQSTSGPDRQGKASFPAYKLSSTLEELCQLPLLTDAQTRVATPEQLFNHNVRFAVFLASKGDRGSRDTLVAAALRGLWQAAQKFDPAKGSNFISYAGWSVRKEIYHDTRTEGQTITIPRAAERRRRVLIEKGRKPAELPQTRSLDVERPSAEGLGTFHEVTPDPALSPSEGVLVGDLRVSLFRCLAKLQPRDRGILEARMGLDGREPPTLQDLATKHGITRERVRQIEFEALRVVREAAKKEKISVDALKLF